MIKESKEFATNYAKNKIKDIIKSILISIVVYTALYFIFDLSWWLLLIILIVDIIIFRIFIKLVLFRYFKIFKYAAKAKDVYDQGKEVYDAMPDKQKEIINIKVKGNINKETAAEALTKLKNWHGKN